MIHINRQRNHGKCSKYSQSSISYMTSSSSLSLSSGATSSSSSSCDVMEATCDVADAVLLRSTDDSTSFIGPDIISSNVMLPTFSFFVSLISESVSFSSTICGEEDSDWSG